MAALRSSPRAGLRPAGRSCWCWRLGGDTLVVETIAILDELEFAGGALHSPEFRVTERIGLSDESPDVLVNRIRMEDPQALAEPYEVTVTYRRDRDNTLIEFQCSENDRNPVNENGKTQFRLTIRSPASAAVGLRSPVREIRERRARGPARLY